MAKPGQGVPIMRPSVVTVEVRSTGWWSDDLTDELEEFLRDPIGYGDYDAADPITLDQFVRPVTHRPFADLIA